MKPQAATAALVLLLLVATAVLGITFEGGGGSSGPGSSTEASTRQKSEKLPQLLVQARIVSPEWLQESVRFLQAWPGANFTSTPPPFPETMLSPISGLEFVLTAVRSVSSPTPRPPLSYSVYTNSTGLGSALLPAGNYTVAAAGDVFNYTGSISMTTNAVTFLGLTVYPSFTNVTSIEVVNPDIISMVEPSGTVFIEVPGSFHYLPDTLYQLVEENPSVLLGRASVSGVLTGEYSSPSGTWVVMDPRGTLQAYPAYGGLLMRYVVSGYSGYLPENFTRVYYNVS